MVNENADMEVVKAEEPIPKLDAAELALGTKLITSKKSRRRLIEGSFNRSASPQYTKYNDVPRVWSIVGHHSIDVYYSGFAHYQLASGHLWAIVSCKTESLFGRYLACSEMFVIVQVLLSWFSLSYNI